MLACLLHPRNTEVRDKCSVRRACEARCCEAVVSKRNALVDAEPVANKPRERNIFARHTLASKPCTSGEKTMQKKEKTF